MDLFDIQVALPPLAALVDRAKVAIRNIYARNMSPVVAWSAGKDSFCVLSLTLEVAKEVVSVGLQPMVIVSNSDAAFWMPRQAKESRHGL